MLSRALSLATATLLIGLFAAVPVRAQAQNLEAGKSPSAIFAGACNACHKSPRGLLKTVSPGSLPGFLREHYTTSSDMASLLSAFLISNGATDTRYGGSQSKPGTDAKSGGGSEQVDRQGRRMRPVSQEAAPPDADGLSQQGAPGRQGRRRLARPGEGPDETKPPVDGQVPAQAGDDRKLTAKQRRLSRRGKPAGEEASKADTAKPDSAKIDAGEDDSPKAEPGKDDKPKSETVKEEGAKPEGINPAGEGKSEAAAATSAAASSGAPEQPAAPRSSAPATSEPPPLGVRASAPPPAHVAAPGPPVPPISQ
jgi:hypothetical protein